MTECCTVVTSTANAMGVVPFPANDFRYLQSKWRTPKAGVTGSTRGELASRQTPMARQRGCRSSDERSEDRPKAHPVGRASKQKEAPAGPLFCLPGVSRLRKRALFDKLREQFDPSGEAAKPAGLKQP